MLKYFNMNIFGKIFLLTILGYFYFLIIASGSMASDICNNSNDYRCTFMEPGIGIGILFMLSSFLFTTVYSLLPNYTFSNRLKILQPYIAIPIFFIYCFILLYI